MTSFAAPCTWDPNQNPGATDESNCVAGTRHFGSLGRNSLKGPSFKEFNFSVFKDTNLAEHVVLTLRAEFFNLFNHPNFSNPLLPNFIGDAGSPDAATGRQTGYYAPPPPATWASATRSSAEAVPVACSSPQRSPSSRLRT